ncbi:MAG TPA: hypothetical protein PKJ97_01995 [Candidatus Bilamarchaeaceae archaeon]|nr:hypothetical protein [Candidatus Bilamarchaeaceae archaeon]
MLRRILEGGSSMRMALEAWIMRAGPERRIENTLGCDEEEVTNAARSVARCWMANGMEDKARKLIETYGLDLEEIRRSSILPP